MLNVTGSNLKKTIIGCLNTDGTHVTANNSTTNYNCVLFVSDLKII